jgi:hypothetical protein
LPEAVGPMRNMAGGRSVFTIQKSTVGAASRRD